MSVRRMTLGAGFRYLMSSVARMDEAGPAGGSAGGRRGLTGGYGYLARVNPDGTTGAVDIPRAPARGLSQIVLGTDGHSRLALLATPPCEVSHASALS